MKLYNLEGLSSYLCQRHVILFWYTPNRHQDQLEFKLVYTEKTRQIGIIVDRDINLFQIERGIIEW